MLHNTFACVPHLQCQADHDASPAEQKNAVNVFMSYLFGSHNHVIMTCQVKLSCAARVQLVWPIFDHATHAETTLTAQHGKSLTLAKKSSDWPKAMARPRRTT